jgi:hypothetical protein
MILSVEKTISLTAFFLFNGSSCRVCATTCVAGSVFAKKKSGRVGTRLWLCVVRYCGKKIRYFKMSHPVQRWRLEKKDGAVHFAILGGHAEIPGRKFRQMGGGFLQLAPNKVTVRGGIRAAIFNVVVQRVDGLDTEIL